MIICIDGANGVGKTALAKRLSKKIDSIIIDDSVLKKYLKNGDYLQARVELQKEFAKYANIILVRWFPSMFTFDYKDSKDEFENAIKFLIKPDYTFIVTANEHKVRHRLKKRFSFSVQKDIKLQLEDFESYAKENNILLLKNNQRKHLIENANLIFHIVSNH